jgi:hypothetical protein
MSADDQDYPDGVSRKARSDRYSSAVEDHIERRPAVEIGMRIVQPRLGVGRMARRARHKIDRAFDGLGAFLQTCA